MLNQIKDLSCQHQLKIAQLQGNIEETHSAAVSHLASVSNEMFSLLRAHGHLNKDLELRFQVNILIKKNSVMRIIIFMDFMDYFYGFACTHTLYLRWSQDRLTAFRTDCYPF